MDFPVVDTSINILTRSRGMSTLRMEWKLL